MHAQYIGFLQLLARPVQYAIPRWQRRYGWGRSDIRRLVADLLTVAEAGDDAARCAGALLTLEGRGVAGVLRTIRVVDDPVGAPS